MGISRSTGSKTRVLRTGFAALCASALLLCSGGAAAATKATGSQATTGFITATGTRLMLHSKPWRFAGYNLPCAQPFLLSDAQFNYYLNDIQINSGANAVRLWFFQSQGGPGNWANFDRVLSDVRAHGMRAVITLANGTSTCDEPSPPSLYKTIQWYQSGYKTPYGGYNLSFDDYAVAVAHRYAGNPAVAFWQLINEASAQSIDGNGSYSCDEPVAAAALRSFADAMVGAIKAVDSRHLVDLGTQGSGQCGTAGGADYTYVHAGAVDLCEYHDYGAPASALPPGADGLTQRVADCNSLNKPLFVGESGIPANVGPDGNPNSACNPWPSCSPYPITQATIEQRASDFKAKIQAAVQAGIAGYLIWVKSPFYTDSTDGYAISDGDPTEGVLSGMIAPYPATSTSKGAPVGPAAVVPESPWAWALGVVAAAAMGMAVFVARRRGAFRHTAQ